MPRSESNTLLIALVILIVLTILTMLTLQSPLGMQLLELGHAAASESSPARSGPTPSPAARPLLDADTSATITLRSAALGFELEYPAAWRRRETALEVIISPSEAGLDPQLLQDSALWIGIPADDMADPERLLANLVNRLAPTTLNRTILRIGAERWHGVELTFESPDLGGESRAIVATTTKNRVGYFVVAAAPAGQWTTVEPAFQRVLGSFRFTQQAVLRPTDATPPPTPTPTPTPVIYVVQPGDTLSGIAAFYGVDMEVLATRNGIDDPRRLRTGQQLIIPIRR